MTRAQVIAAYRKAAELARAQGVDVTFDPGWTTRGREGLTPRAIVEHDTADPAVLGRARMLDILRAGHGAMSGTPICNDAVMRDGEVVVVSAGLAWHAGTSAWSTLTGLNRWSLGTEYHRAQSQPLTDRQVRNGRIWTRARMAAFGVSASMVCEHYECALPKGRKRDRSVRPGVRMTGWRTSLTATPAPTPPAPVSATLLEEIAAMDPKDRQKLIADIADAVHQRTVTAHYPEPAGAQLLRADSLWARAAVASTQARDYAQAAAEGIPVDDVVRTREVSEMLARELIAALRREADMDPDPVSDGYWVEWLATGQRTMGQLRARFGLD